MSDDYTAVNVPGRWIMEKDAEITRLRAENERLRRLVERIVEHHEHDESEVSGWTQWEALVKDARAALEGVTEPASPWRDIESAPSDGTPILCVKQGSGFQPEILHFEDGVFGWLTDDMGFGCHPNRQPTHWMPLPEPPR